MAIVAAMASLLLVTKPVVACDAFVPTFQEVIEGADAILIGEVTEVGRRPDLRWNAVRIEVQRVLRGQAGDALVVDQPAYLCGDGLEQRDVGRRVLIATDVNFGFTEVAPYWWMQRGQLEGWAETPAGVATIDELANLIAALPDTAIDQPNQDGRPTPSPWLPALAGLMALVVFAVRPIGRGQAS